jgi:hypothetical protein
VNPLPPYPPFAQKLQFDRKRRIAGSDRRARYSRT